MAMAVTDFPIFANEIVVSQDKMIKRNVKYGLATCVGVGQGIAAIVENIED